MLLNVGIIMCGTVLKFTVVDPFLPAALSPDEAGAATEGILGQLWTDAYQVVLLTFGENFPDVELISEWPFQLFSVLMAVVGVLGFAVVLGLTEQVILEVLERNVRQGTKVFERRHVLVLAHCIAGKDMETLWRITTQVLMLWLLSLKPTLDAWRLFSTIFFHIFCVESSSSGCEEALDFSSLLSLWTEWPPVTCR